MKQTLLVIALAIALSATTQAAQPVPVLETNTYVLEGVGVRDGVQADIAITVISSDRNNGDDIVGVHGLLNTGNSILPLGASIVQIDKKIRSFIAINMPGRGGSSLPYGDTGFLFGDIGVADQGTIILNVLERLEQNYYDVSTLIAHSMGGLATIVANDIRFQEGSSLSKMGIEVKLIGSSFPGNIADPTPGTENGGTLALINSGAFPYDGLGMIVGIDVPSYLGFFFVRRDGQFDPNTPSPEEVELQGFMAPFDSYAAARDAVSPQSGRPLVSAGGFARKHGKDVTFYVGENDTLTDKSGTIELSKFLTGGLDRVVSIPGTHLAIISEPEAVARAMGYGSDPNP